MALVSYSDSEDSGDEAPPPVVKKSVQPAAAKPTATNFTVDRSQPRKIKVNLGELKPIASTSADDIEERATKRPRVGAGAFSGFNAMLPAPKRNAQEQSALLSDAPKPTERKVFSLKTGAEPGFSRESDAELRQFFAEQDTLIDQPTNGTKTVPQHAGTNEKANESAAAFETRKTGSAMIFKPLSVARKPPKKKPPGVPKSAPALAPVISSLAASAAETPPPALQAKPKTSFFTLVSDEQEDSLRDVEARDDGAPVAQDSAYDDGIDGDAVGDFQSQQSSATTIQTEKPWAQSLDSIAADLNLSAAEKRRLFGRNGKSSGTAINVVNFNTDEEYAANEVLRASGEQLQHNPVRAIASGKHSLKQLVNAASGQKDALEESFASGRRNKREAGNKYGW